MTGPADGPGTAPEDSVTRDGRASQAASPSVAVLVAAGLVVVIDVLTKAWAVEALVGEPIDAGDPLLGLGGSAYLQSEHGLKTGTPPRCDLAKEKTLHSTVRSFIQTGVVKSAHDCSEGGLAVALAECCLSRHAARGTHQLIGAEIDLRIPGRRRSVGRLTKRSGAGSEQRQQRRDTSQEGLGRG